MSTYTVQIPCPVCQEPVTWSCWSEKYGADADGNRWVMVDDTEVLDECPNRCGWTAGQFEEAWCAALEEYGNR